MNESWVRWPEASRLSWTAKTTPDSSRTSARDPRSIPNRGPPASETRRTENRSGGLCRLGLLCRSGLLPALGRRRGIGEQVAARQGDIPLPREPFDELARNHLFDRAGRALQLDAVIALQQREHFLARRAQQFRDLVNPDGCQMEIPLKPSLLLFRLGDRLWLLDQAGGIRINEEQRQPPVAGALSRGRQPGRFADSPRPRPPAAAQPVRRRSPGSWAAPPRARRRMHPPRKCRLRDSAR